MTLCPSLSRCSVERVDFSFAFDFIMKVTLPSATHTHSTHPQICVLHFFFRKCAAIADVAIDPGMSLARSTTYTTFYYVSQARFCSFAKRFPFAHVQWLPRNGILVVFVGDMARIIHYIVQYRVRGNRT